MTRIGSAMGCCDFFDKFPLRHEGQSDYANYNGDQANYAEYWITDRKPDNGTESSQAHRQNQNGLSCGVAAR